MPKLPQTARSNLLLQKPEMEQLETLKQQFIERGRTSKANPITHQQNNVEYLVVSSIFEFYFHFEP